MKHNFYNLEIWKRSRILVKTIYEQTRQFPAEERFGLTFQIRTAAVSVPSNIAESCGRGTDKQLVHFLDISIGSLCELETQVYVAMDLNFLEDKQHETLIAEITAVRKMIMGFKNSIKIV